MVEIGKVKECHAKFKSSISITSQGHGFSLAHNIMEREWALVPSNIHLLVFSQ